MDVICYQSPKVRSGTKPEEINKYLRQAQIL